MQKVSVPNQSCRAPRKAAAAPIAIASLDPGNVLAAQQLRRRTRHPDSIPPAAAWAPSASIEIGEGQRQVLTAIAEEALIVSRADGAAIALDLGKSFECCARAGSVAPAIGTPLNTTTGLSGECLRSGQVVCSIDTERDARVDIHLCRQAGIRSVMIVPMCTFERVIGMLTVFSSHVAAFGPREMTRLQALATSACEIGVSANLPESPESAPAPDVAQGGAILPLQKRPAAPMPEVAATTAEHGTKPSVTPRASAGSREIDRCLETIRQDPALRLLGHAKTYLRIENLYDGEDRTAAIEICDRLIMERGADIGAALKMTDPQSPPR